MEELVAKVFVLSTLALIVFAIMFGLTATVQVNNINSMKSAPAAAILSE